MKKENIFSFIENYALNESNFLNFVVTLCEYFSGKFGVRKCRVEVCEIDPSDAAQGKTPPAVCGGEVVIHKKDGKVSYEVIDTFIKFTVECSKETNKARIVKLAAHEWMHFYDRLFRYKELDRDLIDEEYKDLIIQSIHYQRETRKHIHKKYNMKTYSCLEKLSAMEVVADKHAQEFLKELRQNIRDEKLIRQIDVQIKNHNYQVEECKRYLEENNIDEDCVVMQNK